MRCFGDILNSAINSTCNNQTPHFDGRGYLIPRLAISAVTKYETVMQDFEIADPTDIIPVFMEMDMPYKLAAEWTKNENGIVSGDKTVELFIANNTPLTSKQVMQLNNDSYILAMYDYSGQIILVGADRGLRLTASSQGISSVETHGGFVLTMTETAAIRPQVFSQNVDIIPVTGISLDGASVTIADGATITVDYGFVPTTPTIRTVNAISLNTLIATVIDDGEGQLLIHGEGAGVTTVQCYSVDGNFKAEITVIVTAV